MIFVDRPVGIDLGTTNSEIALLDPSERDLIVYGDRFGRRTIPSAVAWDPKQEAFLVGHAARARRGRTPPPVESIKRKMGQRAEVAVGPHRLSPEEISAKILAELRVKMREQLAGGAPEGLEVRVDRAVITVPAYFDAPQIEATRRAGELAGIDPIGILQEPTAAAMYHTWRSKLGDGCFLVYDLGGGTFDVSVIRCIGGEYQVLAIDGDNYLGGDDFDRRFAEHLRTELVKRKWALELDVRGDEEDRRRFSRLVHLAQEIKESLSTSEVVNVSKQDVVDDKSGEAVSFEAEVGRAEYERVVGDLVDVTLKCCERALARSKEVAGVGPGEIDHVVLVGGSTRMPAVIRRVTEAIAEHTRTKAAPLQDEVDTCVALGAAIHAAQLGGFRIGSPDAKLQVCATTPLVARSAQLRLGLRVEEVPEGTRSIALRSGDEVLAQAPLDDAGAVGPAAPPLRIDVSLVADGETRVSIAARGADEAPLAELPFALWRGEVRPRATSLSQPSVVAKDIALEITRGGRRDRRVLIPRGTGLPAETSARFYTADQSGAVVLRILQHRLPIHTLLLEVPRDTAVGTPVDLALRCDESMKMEARAEIAGQKLWVRIEPPSDVVDPSRAAVDRLLDDADRAGRSLWGSDALTFRRESEPLVTGIREVVATDPDKLAALMTRLHLVLEEFRGGGEGEMTPPMHRFEGALDGLRRVAYRTSDRLLGLDRSAWEARIAELDERGRRAWDANDPHEWRRIYNEAQALLETATQEEFASMRLDDPAYLRRRLAGVTLHANMAERSLLDFVPSAADEVRALQLGERDRLLASLREKVTVPLGKISVENDKPEDVRRALETFGAELTRIDDAIERIPSLGLVADRG